MKMRATKKILASTHQEDKQKKEKNANNKKKEPPEKSETHTHEAQHITRVSS